MAVPIDCKDVEALMRKEYGYLHNIGLFYVSWNGSRRYISLVQYLVCYSVLAIYTPAFLYTAFLCMDDLALFSQSLHIGIVGIVAWTISITGLISRQEIISLHQTSSYHEFETGAILKELQTEREKRKKAILIFWSCYYGLCAVVAVIFAPMIDSYLGVNPAIYVKNGVYMRLPLALWSPVDIESSTVAYLGVTILLAVFAALCASMTTSGVIAALFQQQYMFLQLRLLIHSLKHIENRSRREFKARYPDAECKTTDHRYWLCYEHCFKQNIRHHQAIIRHFQMFKQVVNLPFSVPIIGGAILLAMAVVHMLSDDVRIGPKVLSFMLVLGEMLNMLNLCVFGEELKRLGEAVSCTVYSTKWYETRTSLKRYVSLLNYGANIELVLKAGKLVELNMMTFATIMNSTYSYFNLVYAFK